MVGMDESTKRLLIRARDELIARHRDDPNVSGSGIGFRQRGGQTTTTPAVVVYVARKRRRWLVARDRLLPRTVRVDDVLVEVDVVEVGVVRFFGSPAVDD